MLGTRVSKKTSKKRIEMHCHVFREFLGCGVSKKTSKKRIERF